MSPVYSDMVLVAEHRDREIDRLERFRISTFLGLEVFDRPARFAVLFANIRSLCLPALPDLALLDRRLLLIAVALLGSRHHGRIDDLAAHREVAPIGRRRIEASNELLARLGLHELLAEQPYRGSVSTRPSSPSSRNRWKESRSLIWNSVASSESA